MLSAFLSVREGLAPEQWVGLLILLVLLWVAVYRMRRGVLLVTLSVLVGALWLDSFVRSAPIHNPLSGQNYTERAKWFTNE
jgi:hypothetical protein